MFHFIPLANLDFFFNVNLSSVASSGAQGGVFVVLYMCVFFIFYFLYFFYVLNPSGYLQAEGALQDPYYSGLEKSVTSRRFE